MNYTVALCALEACSLFAAALLLYGKAPPGKWRLAALRLLTAALGLSALAMLFWIVAVATNLVRYDNLALSRTLFIIGLLRAALIALVAAAMAPGGLRRPLKGAGEKELVGLALGEMSLLAMLYAVILVSFGRDGETQLGPKLLLFTLGSLALTAICCFLVRAVYRKRAVERQREEALRLLSAQEKYYTMLLAKEEETRAFRHDIRNHLTCLLALCERGEYDKLKSYLDGMALSGPVSGRAVRSGNRLVDIIIGDLTARWPEVEIKVFGTVPDACAIPDMDVCTIFSNLLTNAFEAASACEDKTVRLHIKFLGPNLLISVQNPVRVPPVIVNESVATTKDGPGHGYGLANVRECLAGYGGTLKLTCEGNTFEASAAIPNVIDR